MELDRVTLRYGRHTALHDISWTFGEGVNGLLGPNGAGKTTLLSLLTTVSLPSEGRIRLNGNDLSTARGRKEARKLLGYVPQRFSLASEMRTRDTVAYAGWINGLPDAECLPAAERALEAVSLSEHARLRVRKLSGGQRQRLGLAAALVHDPSVLVLDEPTVGLDPGQRLRLRELLGELGEQRTVLLSSHLLEDIAQLCGTVAVLAEGRLAFAGSNDEFHCLLEANAPDSTSSALGSPFERAYDTLVNSLGVSG
ncbi:ATP-binding cassette domain-containing protein [Actinopolyspora xinjiangensis]|uniref:ATP-binding cassette domain-containing protein n=1 Tax=Actinopolyspora xinjiangensis TaxID=405564 RepID=UPI001FCD5585|nr:ATP-binding cassette domain-containing protein [Actinopolyspora xinjiangensis]